MLITITIERTNIFYFVGTPAGSRLTFDRYRYTKVAKVTVPADILNREEDERLLVADTLLESHKKVVELDAEVALDYSNKKQKS